MRLFYIFLMIYLPSCFRAGNMDKRCLVFFSAFLSLAFVHAEARGQLKQASPKQAFQKRSLQKRVDQPRNDQVIKRKFSKIQSDIKRGKVRFIGKKPTFKIRPNPVL